MNLTYLRTLPCIKSMKIELWNKAQMAALTQIEWLLSSYALNILWRIRDIHKDIHKDLCGSLEDFALSFKLVCKWVTEFKASGHPKVVSTFQKNPQYGYTALLIQGLWNC